MFTAGTHSANVTTNGAVSGETIYYSVGRLDDDGYIIESLDGETDSLTGFSLNGLIAGNYQLIAVSGTKYAETTFTVSGSGTTAALNFAEKSVLQVSVNLPSNGIDASETFGWLYDSNNKLVGNVIVDENGKLNFAYLDNGTYTLVVLNGKYAAKTIL